MGLESFVFILFIVFLAFRNATRARLKGKSAALYGFLTVMFYFLFYFIGAVVVLLMCRNQINFALANDPNNRHLLEQQVTDAVSNNMLRPLTVQLFGIGGYLLVRYIIDQIPPKSDASVWPDNEKTA